MISLEADSFLNCLPYDFVIFSTCNSYTGGVRFIPRNFLLKYQFQCVSCYYIEIKLICIIILYLATFLNLLILGVWVGTFVFSILIIMTLVNVGGIFYFFIIYFSLCSD